MDPAEEALDALTQAAFDRGCHAEAMRRARDERGVLDTDEQWHALLRGYAEASKREQDARAVVLERLLALDDVAVSR